MQTIGIERVHAGDLNIVYSFDAVFTHGFHFGKEPLAIEFTTILTQCAIEARLLVRIRKAD
jgi:hypothetical protein